MGNRRRTLTATALAFALTTSFLMTLGAVPETVSAYTVYDPIFIDGDAEFSASNGVTGGSGSSSDPYIIEGWEIDASSAHGIWIENTSAHFTIKNCYLRDGGNGYHGTYCGIYLLGCVNGTVTGNTCSNNSVGISLSLSSNNTLINNDCSDDSTGIVLRQSNNNTVSNNNCLNNDYGIWLSESSNNQLSNNNCSLNGDDGMQLKSSSSNTLSNNICLNNFKGIWLYESNNNTVSNNNCSDNFDGIYLFSSSKNVLTNNICWDRKYGIWLSESSNNSVSDNNCSLNNMSYACGIYLHSSTGNTLVNNDCSLNNGTGIHLSLSSDNNTVSHNDCSLNNADGIDLYESSGNTVSNNNCSLNNATGIDISSSSSNTLRNNNCSYNDNYGVYISRSKGTTVYHNIFFDNTVNHAYDESGGTNFWNSSYPIGGNYWGNYTGVDEFSGPNQDQPGPDGMGDTPYRIDTYYAIVSFDYYPLMELPTLLTASFTVSPSTGCVDTVFSVDASPSFDAEDDLTVLEVRWDWESDGIWDTSWSVMMTATHQYSTEGTYTITLEVRDTEGVTDNATRQVTVVLDDEQEDEDDKSFVESYGLPIGIVVALAVVALVLFFVLKGREGGKAPTSLEESPSTEPESQD